MDSEFHGPLLSLCLELTLTLIVEAEMSQKLSCQISMSPVPVLQLDSVFISIFFGGEESFREISLIIGGHGNHSEVMFEVL